MDTVLIFKTSVETPDEIKELKPLLNQLFRGFGKWNFDIEDCDRILRFQSPTPGPEIIKATLQSRGFYCEEL